jgi:hypothetical protein
VDQSTPTKTTLPSHLPNSNQLTPPQHSMQIFPLFLKSRTYSELDPGSTLQIYQSNLQSTLPFPQPPTLRNGILNIRTQSTITKPTPSVPHPPTHSIPRILLRPLQRRHPIQVDITLLFQLCPLRPQLRVPTAVAG